MSLQLAAQHLAARGREGDSTLVHMSPSEVAHLQAIAKAHGTTLTINPETGLPEAFSLKSLIPIIAGLALGPAGLGVTIGGLSSAATAGLLTGGFEALRTGDLGKGLMAGLGAYGGASLGAGAAGAGVEAAQNEAMAQLTEEEIAKRMAESGLSQQGVLNEAAGNAAKNYLGVEGAANPLSATDRFTQSVSAAYDKPGTFVDRMGGGWKTAQAVGAAAIPTMTEMPEMAEVKPEKQYYRGSSFDPYSGEFTYYEPIPINAADGGIMSAAQLAYQNDPVIRMADGGMTPEEFKQYMYGGGKDDALATQRGLEYAAQQGWSPEQTAANWNAALGTNFTTNDYNRAMQQFGIAAPSAGYQAAMQPGGIGADQYYQNIGQKITEAGPNVTYGDVQKMAQPWGVSNQDIQEATERAGLSGAAQYALTHQDIGAAGNVAETYGGLKGLSSNINYWLQQHPGASANDIRDEMKRWDLTDADFIRATGTDVNKYAMGPITEVRNPAEGAGGNLSTVVNENGTITQVAMPTTVTTDPVTGKPAPTATIKNLRDLYTAGGGSLGYQPYAPATTEEFERKFANTGGSKAAYDYLMGKTEYSPVPWTKTGEVMKPYSESVLGVPGNIENKRYIFNPDTRSYDVNPSYKPFVFDPKAPGLTSRGLSVTEAKDWLAANPKATDADMEKYLVTQNKMDVNQLAQLFNTDLATARKRFKSAAGASATASTKDDLTNKDVMPTKNPGAGNEWFWNDAEGRWATRAYATAGASGGIMQALAAGGNANYNLGDYSDGGRLLRGPGDGVSDDIPATIAGKRPARLADGEFVVPARIVSELGNGSTEAGARKLYAMMDRIQANRKKSVGKGKVAVDSRADKHLPA